MPPLQRHMAAALIHADSMPHGALIDYCAIWWCISMPRHAAIDYAIITDYFLRLLLRHIIINISTYAPTMILRFSPLLIFIIIFSFHFAFYDYAATCHFDAIYYATPLFSLHAAAAAISIDIFAYAAFIILFYFAILRRFFADYAILIFLRHFHFRRRFRHFISPLAEVFAIFAISPIRHCYRRFLHFSCRAAFIIASDYTPLLLLRHYAGH